jgi:hypothetical protein
MYRLLLIFLGMVLIQKAWKNFGKPQLALRAMNTLLLQTAMPPISKNSS